MTALSQSTLLDRLKNEQAHQQQVAQVAQAIVRALHNISNGSIAPDDVGRAPHRGKRDGYTTYTIPENPHSPTKFMSLEIDNVGNGTLSFKQHGSDVSIDFSRSAIPHANGLGLKLEGLWKEARQAAQVRNEEKIANFEKSLRAALENCSIKKQDGSLSARGLQGGPEMVLLVSTDKKGNAQVSGFVGDVAIRSTPIAHQRDGFFTTGEVKDLTEVPLTEDRKKAIIKMVKDAAEAQQRKR